MKSHLTCSTAPWWTGARRCALYALASAACLALGASDVRLGDHSPQAVFAVAPAQTIASADLDGDGRPDTVVLLNDPEQSNLRLQLSGAGTWQFVTKLRDVDAVKAVDFNHDGAVDLVVLGSEGILIYLNRGDGRFTPLQPQAPHEGDAITSIAAMSPFVALAGGLRTEARVDIQEAPIGLCPARAAPGTGRTRRTSRTLADPDSTRAPPALI